MTGRSETEGGGGEDQVVEKRSRLWRGSWRSENLDNKRTDTSQNRKV